MRNSIHTRLFVFSVALAIQIVVALLSYNNVDGTRYLPYIAFVLSGALVCSLLRENPALDTFLLGILLAIGGGVEHWIAGLLGIKGDFPGAEGAIMIAFLLLPISILLCATGGCVALIVRRMLRLRFSRMMNR